MKKYLLLIVMSIALLSGCQKNYSEVEEKDMELFSQPVITYMENDAVVGEHILTNDKDFSKEYVENYFKEKVDKIKSGEIGLTENGREIIEKYYPDIAKELEGINTTIENISGKDKTITEKEK